MKRKSYLTEENFRVNATARRMKSRRVILPLRYSLRSALNFSGMIRSFQYAARMMRQIIDEAVNDSAQQPSANAIQKMGGRTFPTLFF